MEIAKLCIDLADFATYVFAHGFKSARGDAGVAQQAAVAAIGGCLSIVYLNLLSFGSDDWTSQIRQEADNIQKRQQQLSSDTVNSLDALRKEADEHYEFHTAMNAFMANLPDETKLSDSIIENVARELHLLLWKYKNVIWKNEEVTDPLTILQPDTALEKIGYLVDRSQSLESYKIDGEFFEVAGLIDKEEKFVQISTHFKLETQNFTAAHELGHALFHSQSILHRDRPLDGSASGHALDQKEMQANKFAACFLMPTRQVVSNFKTLYSMDKFTPSEDNVFAVASTTVSTFRTHYRAKRDVSRLLAQPLADIFQVSLETMAIRLEELGLIEY